MGPSPPGGGAGGAGSSFATMVPRYGCKVSPSRIRNAPPLGADVSCALAGPRIPIDVLFTLSSLSCCNVSRSACKPCVINSSSEPTTPRQSIHIFWARTLQHTIRKTFIMLLEVRFRALASCPDRHGKILVRVPGRRELVQMGPRLILPNDKKADSVGAPTVFLRVDLGL